MSNDSMNKHTCNFEVAMCEKMFANVVFTIWYCPQCGNEDFTCHNYDDMHKFDVDKLIRKS